MKCPRCGNQLSHEVLTGIEVDRCLSCQGVWLDEGELLLVLDSRRSSELGAVVRDAFTGIPVQERDSVELCPKCAKPMAPLNYQYSSGIIIDRCMDGHGVWLDHQELDQIAAHREHWQQESARTRSEWERLAGSERTEALVALKRADAEVSKYFFSTLFRRLLGN